MEQAINFLNILLPVAYMGCLALYVYCFLHSEPAANKAARYTLWGSLALHLVFLVLIGVHYSRPPMANLFEAMSFLAFTVGVVYAYLEWRVKEESGGLFIVIFVLLFQIFSTAYVDHTKNVSEVLSTRSMAFHIGMSLFGISALAISALFSGMYLMLYNNIKNHRFGLLYERLPSLDRLVNLGYHGAFFGFVLLTLGMISGVVQAIIKTPTGSDQYIKVLLVVITWAIYGALVFFKVFRKWQGPRIAYFSLIGFITTILALFVSFHLFR